MIRALLLAAAACVLAEPARADVVPSAVTIVVPFTAGGSADSVARVIAPRLGSLLGSDVRVMNTPGQQSLLGTAEVAKAPPDGRTLLLASPASISFLPVMYPGALTYEPERDLVPIALVVAAPLVLAVHPSLPVRSMDDLVRYARANPNRLQIGTTGPGTLPEFGATEFERLAGIRLRHVPFPGSAEMVDDLVKGKIHLAVDAGLVAAVQAGQLRAIAVASQSRLSALPDLPTASESGLPGYEAVSWYGLFAPRGVPPEIIARIAADLSKVLAQADIVRTLQSRGFQPRGAPPEQLQNFLRAEMARSNRLARDVVSGNR